MYADRLRQRRIDPFGLGGAVFVGGAMIAVMLSAVPNFVPMPGLKHFIVRNYKDPPPPPPVKPTQPQPRAKAAAPNDDRLVTPPLTIIDLPPTDFRIPTGPIDPVVPQPSGGTSTLEPPTSPPPVFVDASADPRYADSFQPPYPAVKIRSGEEGRVTVRVQIGTDGRVKAIEPVGQVDPAFFDATRRQALGRWRFRPATRGGAPVETWKTLSVRFVLTGEE